MMDHRSCDFPQGLLSSETRSRVRLPARARCNLPTPEKHQGDMAAPTPWGCKKHPRAPGAGARQQQPRACPGLAPRQLSIPAAAGEHPWVTASSLSAVPTLGPLPAAEQIPRLSLSPSFVFCEKSNLAVKLGRKPWCAVTGAQGRADSSLRCVSWPC